MKIARVYREAPLEFKEEVEVDNGQLYFDEIVADGVRYGQSRVFKRTHHDFAAHCFTVEVTAAKKRAMHSQEDLVAAVERGTTTLTVSVIFLTGLAASPRRDLLLPSPRKVPSAPTSSSTAIAPPPPPSSNADVELTTTTCSALPSPPRQSGGGHILPSPRPASVSAHASSTAPSVRSPRPTATAPSPASDAARQAPHGAPAASAAPAAPTPATAPMDLNAMIAAAVAAQVAPAVAAAVAPLRGELETVRGELETVHGELETVRGELKSARKRITSLEATVVEQQTLLEWQADEAGVSSHSIEVLRQQATAQHLFIRPLHGRWGIDQSHESMCQLLGRRPSEYQSWSGFKSSWSSTEQANLLEKGWTPRLIFLAGFSSSCVGVDGSAVAHGTVPPPLRSARALCAAVWASIMPQSLNSEYRQIFSLVHKQTLEAAMAGH